MTRFWITLDQGVNFVLSVLQSMIGGEIFIPKIPSMKIEELVKSIAPEIPVKIIGIRPGEKLHEVMITEDDAPYTYSLDDRYVILPAFDLWGRGAFSDPATKVVDRFRYSSDTNPEFLTVKHMRKLLE